MKLATPFDTPKSKTWGAHLHIVQPTYKILNSVVNIQDGSAYASWFSRQDVYHKLVGSWTPCPSSWGFQLNLKFMTGHAGWSITCNERVNHINHVWHHHDIWLPAWMLLDDYYFRTKQGLSTSSSRHSRFIVLLQRMRSWIGFPCSAEQARWEIRDRW